MGTLSTTELNRASDYSVASAMTCRIHTADPGVNGTTSRIGALSEDLAVADWSAASAGDVQYDADLDFGVLHASNNITVSHYSLWRGASFVARGALASNVAVTAGGTFKINSGTIEIDYSSV